DGWTGSPRTDEKERKKGGRRGRAGACPFFTLSVLIRSHPCTQSVYEVRGLFFLRVAGQQLVDAAGGRRRGLSPPSFGGEPLGRERSRVRPHPAAGVGLFRRLPPLADPAACAGR